MGSAGCKAAAAHQTDKVGVIGNEYTRAPAQLALGGPGSKAHKQGWSEPKMRALRLGRERFWEMAAQVEPGRRVWMGEGGRRPMGWRAHSRAWERRAWRLGGGSVWEKNVWAVKRLEKEWMGLWGCRHRTGARAWQ